MPRQEIVALFDRRREAVERRDGAALASVHGENSVYESPMAGKVVGRGALAQVYEAWFKGFPDLVMTGEELVIDGNRVAQTMTLSGTDTGGFMGLPPTGKPFEIPMVFLCTIEDGLIGEALTIYDFTGMLVQIGVLKAKPV